MNAAFIRKGHGYATGSQGRCTAFDGFEIVAAPLHREGEDEWQAAFGNAAREARVYRRASGNGTDYGSHAIKLGRMGGDLYILMHNGSGREVLAVPKFYDGGDLEAAILAMPERLQYALLYTIWQAASNARYEAQRQTAETWSTAYVEKRLKKRRGTNRVEIIHPSMMR